MHIPGAEEAYLKTIDVRTPVRRPPTTSMKPVQDPMYNCSIVLFKSCALVFLDKSRSGLDKCDACNSYECEHCFCSICGHDACEHFFVPPPMNPALVVALRNATL
jgi:hypothetical protein